MEGVRKSFRGVHAVTDASFAVARGSITGLIGPNGSGKSTTIDCLSGFQRPDAGRVLLDGQDITGLPAHLVARAGLRRSFQQVRLFDALSLRDNLMQAAQAADGVGWLGAVLRSPALRRAELAAAERAWLLLDQIGLTRLAESPAGALSYGQKKLAALAAALMPRPRLVVLDEPMAGVNPSRIVEVEAILRRLNAAGETFLIVEHNVDCIMRLCHEVVVFEQGRTLTSGPPAMVRDDPRVLEAYLGVPAAA
nr:ABC transporter ATP-binding protein [Roseomonas acroporae]